eukprot:20209-Heterococcus_DN1.PRE.1
MQCKLQWLSIASNGQQFNDIVAPVACCESTLPLLKKEHWKADAAATRAINKQSTRTTAMIASCTAQHLSCGGFFTFVRNDFLIRAISMMLQWFFLELLLLVCSSAAFSSVHTTFKLKNSLVTGLPTAKPVLELVTPDGAAQGDTDVLINKIADAIKGGVRLVQFRDYVSSSYEKVAFAHKLSAVLAQPANAEALFVINGDIDLAVSCSADGVHLPERMIASMQNAKQLLKIVGCSVHSVESAVLAAQSGANYIQIGTMFESKTHPGKVPEGVQLLKDIRSAISDLDSTNAQDVVLIGIGGITAVSGFHSPCVIIIEATAITSYSRNELNL